MPRKVIMRPCEVKQAQLAGGVPSVLYRWRDLGWRSAPAGCWTQRVPCAPQDAACGSARRSHHPDESKPRQHAGRPPRSRRRPKAPLFTHRFFRRTEGTASAICSTSSIAATRLSRSSAETEAGAQPSRPVCSLWGHGGEVNGRFGDSYPATLWHPKQRKFAAVELTRLASALLETAHP